MTATVKRTSVETNVVVDETHLQEPTMLVSMTKTVTKKNRAGPVARLH